MRPPLVLMVLVLTVFVAFESASAAPTSTARFLVSVRATLKKQWTYTTSRTSEGCRVRVSGTGTRTISLRSRDVSLVAVRWSGGRSHVRFSGGVGPLGVTVRQLGTKRTTTSGPAGCDDSVRSSSCTPVTRTFQGPRARLASGRAHRLSFRRMKNFVPDAFFNDCPGEPAAIRRINAGLAFADAGFSERELFDRNVGGITLDGDAEGTTTLVSGSGRVAHRVHWALTLRRVGG
jgi:hypothetical protein